MAKDDDTTAPAYANPDQKSGFHDDPSKLTYWDPAQQKMVTVDVEGNPNDIKSELGLGHYQNQQGDFVYGARPDNLTYDPSGEFMVSRPADYAPPEIQWPDSGLSLGGPAPAPAPTPPPTGGGGTPPPTGGGGGDPFDPNGGSGAPDDTVRDDIPKPPDETEVKPWEPSDSQDSSKTWNWDYFAPKQAGDGQWGGYDEDYGVFERYQPGQDSPWGMPDIEGGNQNFYQQQFNNMLRDEQGYRSQQRAAQLRGQKSEQAKQKAIADGTANINYEDMWESMGITPNKAVQQDVDAEGNPVGGAYDWSFNSALGGLGKGSTNQEILNASLGQLDQATAKMLGDGYQNRDDYDTWKDSKYWSQFTNPTDLKSAFTANQGPDGLNPEWANANYELFSNMFTRNDLTTPVGGGPSAAPGYASPI